MSGLKASIDIGSNSVLLLVADITSQGIVVKENYSEVTGLGKLLDKNGKFLKESMDDTFNALKQYAVICSSYNINPGEIIATATEAARVSGNSAEFFNRIKKELGITVKIISGEAEAMLSAKGILCDKSIKQSELIIMDIGGASTELIKVNAETSHLLTSFSMPIGAVRFTNWKEEGILSRKVKEVNDNYKDDLLSVKTKYLHCVAGTMTSIGNMSLGHKEFVEEEVHGLELDVSTIRQISESTMDYNAQDYQKQFPFLGKRSMTIRGGLDLALNVFEWLEVEQVRISTYGLRYGALITGVIGDEYIYRK